MPAQTLLLVTDARWPLDADGAMIAHNLQAATRAQVTILRVPDDATAYRFVPAGEGLVVVIADKRAVPVGPPVGWKHPVCWHVSGGCSAGWNGGGATDSISSFVSRATASPLPVDATNSPGFALASTVLLVALAAAWRILRRGRD